jgi:hypothetical protein
VCSPHGAVCVCGVWDLCIYGAVCVCGVWDLCTGLVRALHSMVVCEVQSDRVSMRMQSTSSNVCPVVNAFESAVCILLLAYGGVKLHVDISITTAVATPTKREHAGAHAARCATSHGGCVQGCFALWGLHRCVGSTYQACQYNPTQTVYFGLLLQGRCGGM